MSRFRAAFGSVLLLSACGKKTAATPSGDDPATDLTAPVVSVVGCEPSPVQLGDLLSVVVRASEALAAPPAVEISDWLAACAPTSVNGEFACDYLVHGGEGEGDVPVRVTSHDPAGNVGVTEATCPFTGPPPRIVAVDPHPGQVVPADVAMQVVFSKPMQQASLAGAVSLSGATGQVTYDPTSQTARFTPTQELHYGAAYTLQVGPAAIDRWGQPIDNPQEVIFRVGAAVAIPLPAGDLAASLANPAVAVAANGNAAVLMQVDGGGYQAVIYDTSRGVWGASEPRRLRRLIADSWHHPQVLAGDSAIAIVYYAGDDTDRALLVDYWREGNWHLSIIDAPTSGGQTAGMLWKAAMRENAIAVASVNFTYGQDLGGAAGELPVRLAFSVDGRNWVSGGGWTGDPGALNYVEIIDVSIATLPGGELAATVAHMDWNGTTHPPLGTLSLTSAGESSFRANDGIAPCMGGCASAALATLPGGEVVFGYDGFAGEVFATAFAGGAWSAPLEVLANPPGWFDLTAAAPGATGQVVLLRPPPVIPGPYGAAAVFVWDGAAWSAPRPAASFGDLSLGFSAVVATDGNGFRALWSQPAAGATATQGTSELWSSEWTGADWGMAELVASATGSACCVRGSLRGVAGAYVATWTDNWLQGPTARASLRTATGWTSAVEIPTATPAGPLILAAPGRLGVIWQQNDAVWERSATAAGLGDPILVTNLAPGSDMAWYPPRFATSERAGGAAVVTLSLGAGSRPAATVARLGATGWEPTELAFVSPPSVPTQPVLLATSQSGDLLVRWRQADGYTPRHVYSVLSHGLWSPPVIEALPASVPRLGEFVANDTAFLHVGAVPETGEEYAEVWTPEGWGHRVVLASAPIETFVAGVGTELLVLWQTQGAGALNAMTFDGQSWLEPVVTEGAVVPYLQPQGHRVTFAANRERFAFWSGPVRNTVRIYETGAWREVAPPAEFAPFTTANVAMAPFGDGVTLAWDGYKGAGPEPLWLAVLAGDAWQAHNFGPVAGVAYWPLLSVSENVVLAKWGAASSETAIAYSSGVWVGPASVHNNIGHGPGGYLLSVQRDAECRVWLGQLAPSTTVWTDSLLEEGSVGPGCSPYYFWPSIAATSSMALVMLPQADPVSHDLWVRVYLWRNGSVGTPRDLVVRPGLTSATSGFERRVRTYVNGDAILLVDDGRAALFAGGAWTENVVPGVLAGFHPAAASAALPAPVQTSNSHFAVGYQPPVDMFGAPRPGEVHLVH